MIPGVEATCTKTGLTAGKKCSVCGEVLEEQQTVAMKAHTYGEWKIEKDATCTEDGVMTRICTRCSGTERKTVEKLGHSDSDNDGICDVCGEDLSKSCSCGCHSTNGFISFLWKIKLFFIKIFGVQKVCACGKKHY